jgi:hypothetical protein
VLGRYDLGRYPAAPLGAIWLIWHRQPDEGQGRPFGPDFLDGSVGERQPLTGPGA